MRVVILCPLWIEALATRSALPAVKVRRTGMGPGAADVPLGDADAIGVAGLCGAVAPGLRAGDVVLASELRAEGIAPLPCSGSALLAEPLRRLGLRAVQGPLYSAPRILGRDERLALREDGVLAVDMESAWIARAAGDTPLAVMRVVVDTADRRLASPHTLWAGIRGLWALRRASAAFVDWAELCAGAPTAQVGLRLCGLRSRSA